MKVGRALRKGRTIPAEDMPVATSIVALQGKQRWLPWLYIALAAIWVVNAFAHHGLVRWLYLASAVLYLLILLPLILRQRRKTITNYARQNSQAAATSRVDPDHQD